MQFNILLAAAIIGAGGPVTAYPAQDGIVGRQETSGIYEGVSSSPKSTLPNDAYWLCD